jgi:hypothetical protein
MNIKLRLTSTPSLRCQTGCRFLAFTLVSLATAAVQARDFRVNQLPNGAVNRCANCHISPSGGGNRNAFGLAVQSITGSGSAPFWRLSLAILDSDGDGFTNGEELGDPNGDGVPVPGAPVTIPGQAASRPNPAPLDLGMPEVQPDGTSVRLQWTGGLGAGFMIQWTDSLTEASWMNLLTLAERQVTFPALEAGGFFRLVDRPTNTVRALTVQLNGSSEVPPVSTMGVGSGFLSLEGSRLVYRIPFSGLSSEASGAHIHGPASTAESAAVLYPLVGAQGTAGALAGEVTLDSDAHRNLLFGSQTYVNINTLAHGDGEIRGQIAPVP